MPPGAKSMDNYHAITPFYRDFCPPIISLVKKPSQWEIASLRVSLFSSLLLYMEGKQNIFIVSTYLKCCSAKNKKVNNMCCQPTI